MILSNKKFFDEIGKLYTRDLCIKLFTNKRVKEYYDLIFCGYARSDMQTYIQISNINVKIKLLNYFRKHIQTYMNNFNIDYDKFNSPNLLNEVKVCFTKEICDELFIEDGERIWNLFIYKKENFIDFLKYINILDKLHIFIWIQSIVDGKK